MKTETIHGFARLDLQGILLNEVFIPLDEMNEIVLGDSDVIVPLYSNQMNRRKAVSDIRMKAAQNNFERLSKK